MATSTMTVTTPLGPDTLEFKRLDGREEISACFEFRVELVSTDTEIAPADLLGETLQVTLSEHRTRHFHGHVTAFALQTFDEGEPVYAATVRPWLWFLSTRTDCRIFQEKTVVEIIEEVFSAYPDAAFEKRLQHSYPPREYCVQYDESDLDFVQRLMEHEGIFYFFEHTDGAHTLILTDANAELKPAEGYGTLSFSPDYVRGIDDDAVVTQWRPVSRVVSGAYAHTDFDFTKPAADLMAKSDKPLGHTLDDGEVYSHPGAHLQVARGDAIATVRREALQATSYRVEARSFARGVGPGCTFALQYFPREIENAEFLVIAATYVAVSPAYRSAPHGEAGHEGIVFDLVCAPLSLPFRPARTTPRPVMRGPQTATVTGPGGEEIFTDAHGRVKVQFHWDRQGARDENSSCFVRVSSVWAGAGWGFIQIPRIGHEVIVDFIEGDPDKPLITGRVYNGANMPPYALPANATQSGWKSNSSLGGGGFNELRFEDKKGSEQVYFQAEKDHVELVKNDEVRLIQHDMAERVDNNSSQSIGVDRAEDVGNNKSTSVGVDRSVSIGNNDTETVGANRSLSVGVDETILIGSNATEAIGANHSQSVGANQTINVAIARNDVVGAAESRTVGAAQTQQVGAARSVSVGAGQSHVVGASDTWTVGSDQSVTIGASQTTNISADHSLSAGGSSAVSIGAGSSLTVTDDRAVTVGKTYTLSAADEIVLKTGSASITMKKDGTITIKGKDVTIDGSGEITAKASKDVTIKGAKVKQN